jgi:hypothetical protein
MNEKQKTLDYFLGNALLLKDMPKQNNRIKPGQLVLEAPAGIREVLKTMTSEDFTPNLRPDLLQARLMLFTGQSRTHLSYKNWKGTEQ